MHHSPILGPIVALAAWTIVMQIWLYAERFPALKRKGISLKGRVGSKGGDLDEVLEPEVQWKAHNYNHLLEQPTIFYAIALSLALMNFGGGINLYFAWAYVGFRVIHSLIQATVNIVIYRFWAFALGTACLIGLTTHAAIYLIRHA